MGDYNHKRPRTDDDDYYDRRKPNNTYTIFDRLYFDIVEIGDPSRMKLVNRIAQAATGFASHIDNLAIRNGVLETFIAAIVEQPHKTHLVAAVVLVSNSVNGFVGQLVTEHVHSRIEIWLKEGDYKRVKIVMRFLACLEPIIHQGRGIFNLMDSLLDRAIELKQQAPSGRSALGEELFAAVFLALPYLGSTKYFMAKRSKTENNVGEELQPLIKKAKEHFFSLKHNVILEHFSGENSPYKCELYLENLFKAVESVSSDWKIPFFINVFELIEPVMECVDTEVKRHAFPTVSIPEVLPPSKSNDYTLPQFFFRSYLPINKEAGELHTVPLPHTLEAVLCRDLVSDCIDHLDFNRKEAAKQIFTLDLFLAEGTFAGPGISIDKLSSQYAEDLKNGIVPKTLKIEDVAAEAVLSQLFRLPQTPRQPAYYHALFIEACIMAPQAIAPVFGRAVRFLFANLGSFDVELLHRFLDWFSHHLSNFGFTWKWQEWVDYVNLHELDPRLVFIKQLILKELRLSFELRIKETLSDEFFDFLPKNSEEPPVYEYINTDHPYKEAADLLLDIFKDKYDLGAGQEFQEVLSTVKEVTGSEKATVEVVVGGAIFIGSRSLFLSQEWISRLSQQLSYVVESIDDEHTAVMTVVKFYKNQPHLGVLVLHYLMQENIINPSAILTYLFEAKGYIVFTQSYGWECLIRTLNEVASESDSVIHSSIFAQVFQALSHEVEDSSETSKWILWWQNQVIKVLIRKYTLCLSSDSVFAVLPSAVKSMILEYQQVIC